MIKLPVTISSFILTFKNLSLYIILLFPPALQRPCQGMFFKITMLFLNDYAFFKQCKYKLYTNPEYFFVHCFFFLNWSVIIYAKINHIFIQFLTFCSDKYLVCINLSVFHFLSINISAFQSQNPFTQSSAEVDILIRHHAPSRDFQRRNSSISNKERDQSYSRSIKRIIPFDQTYKNLHPPKLLGRIMCNAASDPVTRHGTHTQELKIHARQGELSARFFGS